MAKVEFDVGLNILTQTAQGTLNTTVSGSTTIEESNGGVMGHPDAGEGRSGVSFTTSRGLIEKADATGSFTKQPSDFIREQIESFSIAIPLKGNGGTADSPVTDGNITPLNGIDAILRALGLTGAGSGGTDTWVYTPNPAGVIYCTAKLFVGQTAFVLQDCVASGSIAFTPNGIGILTANFSVGSVQSFAELAFPTSPAYGTQATLSAPAITSVNHTWSTARGFSDFTLTIDNGLETVGDSNQSVGTVDEQTARTISASVTMYTDPADDDFEHGQLVLATAAGPTDLLSFTAGAAATAAGTVNGYTVKLTNPETRSITPRRLGNQLAYDVELVAVETVPDTEFELVFI